MYVGYLRVAQVGLFPRLFVRLAFGQGIVRCGFPYGFCRIFRSAETARAASCF